MICTLKNFRHTLLNFAPYTIHQETRPLEVYDSGISKLLKSLPM